VIAKEARVVHSYLPIKGEIDVSPFLKWLLDKQIKVVCPMVLPKRQLESLELLHFDHFDTGPFNTLHPAGNAIYKGNIDLVIMPGLAYDTELNRLGYGGGYYDRFLANHPDALKAAVLYPFQLIDKVPIAEHDVKMDELVLSTRQFKAL
jgi:5-formyltetrahydrofolate cyclo-ligase